MRHIFTLSQFCIGIYFALEFRPEIQMPFKKISGFSNIVFRRIRPTLNCDELCNSLKECAVQCFERSLKENTSCPGFVFVDSNQNNVCYLCQVGNYSEMTNSLNATFSPSSVLYLTTYKNSLYSPEVSMDFDNYTGTRIFGPGVEGTIETFEKSQHVEGVKGQGLYLHDRARVQLTGSGTECWTNLDHCTSGMTVSIWYKPKSQIKSYIASSGSKLQQGFNFVAETSSTLFFVDLPTGRYKITSDIILVAGSWWHIAGTFNNNSGIEIDLYINGLIVSTNYTTQPPSLRNEEWTAYIGIKDHKRHRDGSSGFPIDGAVDEFRYYYTVLSPGDIWREYVEIDIDLQLKRIRNWSVVESKENVATHHNIMDGNQATCISASDALRPVLMSKLYNSALNKNNFTISVITEHLECDSKRLVVQTEQDLPDDLNQNFPDDALHFIGKRKTMHLTVSSVNGEGQNVCVFRHICKDLCHYVFIFAAQDHYLSKICEVYFE